MLQSAAWRNLSGAALKVYFELRTRFHGGNNGSMFLSYEEAAKLLHLSKSTIKRGFKDLEAKGFIKKTRKGEWYGRQATLWALTDKVLKHDLPTNDWKHWTPGEKTFLGTNTARPEPTTMPPEYRETETGAKPVLVRPVSRQSISTVEARL